ncbi:YcxB family protein [Streptomyces sp. NPDC002766]|uniref:YcxB family protein n=1 Tax=Streptomyces sp. NPDC002766 TaxID=3154429 RepID=UPI00333315CB
MVMDTGRDAEQGAVELTYEPVVNDFLGVLRERDRLRRRAWIRYWALGIVGVSFVLNASLTAAGTARPNWFLLVWMPLLAVFVLFTPRIQARAFLKLAVRNGTFRATVTDAGLTMVTDNSTTSVKWAAQPRYRETEDAFFTYSDDKNAGCFTVLPKRGLAGPADADRLREILDRNLTRV